VLAQGGQFCWYLQQNTSKDQIMVLSFMQGNNALISDLQRRTDTVMSLDLVTKKWSLVGGLNAEIAKTFPTNRLIANMDSGLLVNNTGVIEFWNLVTNRIYKLKETAYRQNLLTGHYQYCISWTEGNKIIFGDSDLKPGIDSIVISQNDFEPTENQIFSRSNNSAPYLWGLALALFLAGMYGYLKNRSSRKTEIHSDTAEESQSSSELNSSYPKQQLFSPTESDLLRLIIRNAKEKNRYTNVDEINRVLGVGNKSMDMQKRKRSDVIKSINERFSLATNRHSIVLINRIKSELDGRLFEFYILEEELPTILKFIS
jgi:hypothetical protein